MSTYRKIEAEVRDEDVSKTISYSKVKKDGDVIEKVFIKDKEDRKTVSEVRGTSTNGSDWEIKGEDMPVAYKKYTPDTIFKDFGFMSLDSKKIGGGDFGMNWSSMLVVLLIIIIGWFVYEYMAVLNKIEISNMEKSVWNNAEPKPIELKVMDTPDMCQIAVMARGEMVTRFGKLIGVSR
jgi:hypothetical protein